MKQYPVFDCPLAERLAIFFTATLCTLLRHPFALLAKSTERTEDAREEKRYEKCTLFSGSAGWMYRIETGLGVGLLTHFKARLWFAVVLILAFASAVQADSLGASRLFDSAQLPVDPAPSARLLPYGGSSTYPWWGGGFCGGAILVPILGGRTGSGLSKALLDPSLLGDLNRLAPTSGGWQSGSSCGRPAGGYVPVVITNDGSSSGSTNGEQNSPAPVPEPATILLVGSGLTILFVRRCRLT